MRMRNFPRMRATSISGDDVIRTRAYDIIDGQSLTLKSMDAWPANLVSGERGPPSSKASTAELVLPNCGKRRSERHRLLNPRQWRSTWWRHQLDYEMKQVVFPVLLHLFKP